MLMKYHLTVRHILIEYGYKKNVQNNHVFKKGVLEVLEFFI